MLEFSYYRVLLNECSKIEPTNNAGIINWDEVFYTYEKCHQIYLFEQFDFLGEENLKNGINHKYEVETRSGKKFSVLITYYNHDVSYNLSNDNEAYVRMKKDNILGDEFNVLKKKIENTNKNVCMINFVDSSENNKLTGTVGYESFEVFRSLTASLENSLIRKGMIHNLVSISMRVSKTESARKSLYIKMFQRRLSQSFPNFFEDTVTNTEFDTLYFTQ